MARTALAIVCAALFSPVGTLAAAQNDIVVLLNGDRMTCEVKELNRGRLSVKTDALDTVSVYWGQVDSLSTASVFEIQISNGDRFFGRIDQVGPRRVRVMPTAAPSLELSLDDIVRMAPFDATVWQRMDGHVDLGFSFAKADLETSWTLNADTEYRSRHWLMGLTAASQLTLRDNADRLSRNALSVMASRSLSRNWFILGLGQLQENEELSLELRTVGGGGAGRYLMRSNRTTLQAYAGLVYTQEKYTDTPRQESPEVSVGADWNWFTSRNNNLDLSTSAISYFAVREDRRRRVELQSALRIKFLSDFYVSVNGYDSYDSNPPEGSATTDLGISVSLGWKFGSLGAF